MVQDHGDYLSVEERLTTNGLRQAFFRRVANRKTIYAHWILEEGVPLLARGPGEDPNGNGITNSFAYAFAVPAAGVVPAEDLARLPHPVSDPANAGPQ